MENLDSLLRDCGGSVSHDFFTKDPYQMIEELAGLMRSSYKDNDPENVEKYLKMITIANEKGSKLVDKDSLTGIMKRASFERHFNHEYSRFNRGGNSFAVMIADVDNFKVINDNYGHLGGDDALKEIVNRLGKGMRKIDGIYRYAGDELAGVFSGVDEEQALSIANRAVKRVSGSSILTRDGASLEASVSVGVYLVNENDSFATAVKRADLAAYESKELGKNRASIYIP